MLCQSKWSRNNHHWLSRLGNESKACNLPAEPSYSKPQLFYLTCVCFPHIQVTQRYIHIYRVSHENQLNMTLFPKICWPQPSFPNTDLAHLRTSLNFQVIKIMVNLMLNQGNIPGILSISTPSAGGGPPGTTMNVIWNNITACASRYNPPNPPTPPPPHTHTHSHMTRRCRLWSTMSHHTSQSALDKTESHNNFKQYNEHIQLLLNVMPRLWRVFLLPLGRWQWRKRQQDSPASTGAW